MRLDAHNGGLKVVYFMMFISLIALVVKISVLVRKFFLEVNQVKLTFSRGQWLGALNVINYINTVARKV